FYSTRVNCCFLDNHAYTTRRRRLVLDHSRTLPQGDGRMPQRKGPARSGPELRGEGWPISPPRQRLDPADVRSATTPLVTPIWPRSALRKLLRQRKVVPAIFWAFASLQLMKSLAAGRTIANVNPPAAVPQITGADT